jgi:hypothetical protein
MPSEPETESDGAAAKLAVAEAASHPDFSDVVVKLAEADCAEH